MARAELHAALEGRWKPVVQPAAYGIAEPSRPASMAPSRLGRTLARLGSEPTGSAISLVATTTGGIGPRGRRVGTEPGELCAE
jgi:hypothetical protein